MVKKPVVAVVLSTLLLLTFGLGIADRANAFMGGSLPYIYIREDGSIEPSTAHIHRNGNIYTLTGDIIKYTLLIACDNIVVDGKGFTLQGRGRGPIHDCAIEFGLTNYTIGRKNVTIKNFNIENFHDGIKASYLCESAITGNTISCDRAMNIGPKCSRNQITDNKLIGALQDFGYGIYVSGSYNIVTGNNISNYSEGIVFVGEHNIASNNVLVGTTVHIDVERAPDTILENNTLPVASPSPSPEPSSTPEPTSTPYNEPTGQGLILGVLAIVVVCAFGLVLLYRIKRKSGSVET